MMFHEATIDFPPVPSESAVSVHGVNELRVVGLECKRGNRRLFSGVDFALRGGEWLHVRGANGAGKTSLLRILAGLSRPDAGAVQWNGVDIARASDAFRSALAWFGHHAGLKGELSAVENLRLAASLDGARLDLRGARAALAQTGLAGREHLPLRALSQGQRRRVLLARVLARRARLWILDEPMAALDPSGVALVERMLERHLADGGCAVVTSHQPVSLGGGQTLELAR